MTMMNYVKLSIKELNKFNNNLMIVSWDNVYNCLSTGFLSGIIESNKNVFILDREDNNL